MPSAARAVPERKQGGSEGAHVPGRLPEGPAALHPGPYLAAAKHMMPPSPPKESDSKCPQDTSNLLNAYLAK